jgi:hypothetical protein
MSRPDQKTESGFTGLDEREGTMKVKELVEKLQRVDPESEVAVYEEQTNLLLKVLLVSEGRVEGAPVLAMWISGSGIGGMEGEFLEV